MKTALITGSPNIGIAALRDLSKIHDRLVDMDIKETNTKDSKEIAKGEYNGECNRTACNNKEAKYFNHSTKKYYCESCALLINRNNPEALDIYGHVLCSIDDTPMDVKEQSFTEGEKKKKKPCTYHEYTNRGRVEVSPNMYTEIWKCRHCEHPLK